MKFRVQDKKIERIGGGKIRGSIIEDSKEQEFPLIA